MAKADMPEGFAQELTEAIIHGVTDTAVQTTHEALEAGADPLALIQQVIVPTLTEIGLSFFETGHCDEDRRRPPDQSFQTIKGFSMDLDRSLMQPAHLGLVNLSSSFSFGPGMFEQDRCRGISDTPLPDSSHTRNKEVR